MAPEPSENWSLVAQIILSVFGAIGAGFLYLYKKAGREEGGEIVAKNVGAAFMDRTAAKDLARVADNSDKMLDLMEAREKRWHDGELLRQLEEKMLAKRKPEGEGH